MLKKWFLYVEGVDRQFDHVSLMPKKALYNLLNALRAGVFERSLKALNHLRYVKI